MGGIVKVAAVIDQYTLAFNAGSNHGIKVGQLFCVANSITDPESGIVLGFYPNLKVVVTQVFERFSVAETVRTKFPSPIPVTVNIGDDIAKVM